MQDSDTLQALNNLNDLQNPQNPHSLNKLDYFQGLQDVQNLINNLENLKYLNGRMMPVRDQIFIDYAHTPDAIKQALDKTPPEHHADILDFGIILTGGGALLKNLDEHVRNLKSTKSKTLVKEN